MAKMFGRRKSPAAKAAKALKARRRKGPAERLKRGLPGGKKRGISPAVALGAVAAVGVAALSIGALRSPIATFGKRAAKSVGKRATEDAVDRPAASAEKVQSS